MPPVDAYVEAAGLKRRRALLEALQQKGMNPQIQGTPNQGIAQLLASLGTSYFAGQGLNQVDQQEQQLAQQRQGDLASELERFMQTGRGQPGQYQLPPDQAGPQVPDVAGDPQRAVLDAMTSRFPEMQQIGGAMLPEMMKPPSKPKREVRFAPDGTKLELVDGEVVSEGPKGQYAKTPDSTVINTFPKVEEQLLKNVVDSVSPDTGGGKPGKLYADYSAAMEHVVGAQEAINALDKGASSGTFEPFFQAARGLAGRFLGVDPKTVNTSVLASSLAKITLAAAGGSLGNQVSNADRDFIAEAQGSIGAASPEALRRILAINVAVSVKRSFNYRSTMQRLREKGGVYDTLASTPLPDISLAGLPPDVIKMVENVLLGKNSTTQSTPLGNESGTSGSTSPGNGSGITYTPRGRGG